MPELFARISSVHFKNYKALSTFSLRLSGTNILVGPNNAGKSTIIGAFRALAVALRRMRRRKPDVIVGPSGACYGVIIPSESLPISVENIHSDYSEDDSTVTFTLSNKNTLQLYFGRDGSCKLIADAHGKPLNSTAAFRNAFPIDLAVVPVLGPLEHREEWVEDETVQRNLMTHRASRNFRNFWYHFPENFSEFAALIKDTWDGMEIEPPEVTDHGPMRLSMFCRENRMTREIYWAGFGFQVWSQILTHIVRAKTSSMLIIDEPEIYLHADLQRQLLNILRESHLDLILATHSTEIMGEADPSELILIDKTRRSGERLKTAEKLQEALEVVGSVHNVSMARLTRNRRILFVEGDKDFKLLRMFARQVGLSALASGLDITPLPSGGFGSWKKVAALGWGLSTTLGHPLVIGAIYDRDYFSAAYIAEVQKELSESITLAHIHERKELENYLMTPIPLANALKSAVEERATRMQEVFPEIASIESLIFEATDEQEDLCRGQFVGKRIEDRKDRDRKLDLSTHTQELLAEFQNLWNSIEGRIQIVSGKVAVRKFRVIVNEKYGVSITDYKIIDAHRREDIPNDLRTLLTAMDEFRLRQPV